MIKKKIIACVFLSLLSFNVEVFAEAKCTSPLDCYEKALSAMQEARKDLQEIKAGLGKDVERMSADIKVLEAQVDNLNKSSEAQAVKLNSNVDLANSLQGSINSFKSKQNNPSQEIVSHDGPWGTWRPVAICASGSYVCGVQAKFEEPARDSDDTALNTIKLFCCPF